MTGVDFAGWDAIADVLLAKHYFWHRGIDGLYGTVARWVQRADGGGLLHRRRRRRMRMVLLLLLLAAAGASAADWQTVYEGDLRAGSGLNDWIPVLGDWTLTPEGMKKTGMGADGLLVLRLPVVRGAVRVE